jgi:hypothetical protein
MFVGDWLIDCDTLDGNEGAQEILCHAIRVSAAAGTMAFELDGAVCKQMCGGVFLTTLTQAIEASGRCPCEGCILFVE